MKIVPKQELANGKLYPRNKKRYGIRKINRDGNNRENLEHLLKYSYDAYYDNGSEDDTESYWVYEGLKIKEQEINTDKILRELTDFDDDAPLPPTLIELGKDLELDKINRYEISTEPDYYGDSVVCGLLL